MLAQEIRVGGTVLSPSIIGKMQGDNSGPLVVYHANCPDGFCAAFIASLSLPNNAQFYAAHYGGELPDFKDRHVIFVDWCPKEHQLCLLEEAASVTVLDHHITAKDSIEKLGGTCDTSKSGAMLTWEYFNPGMPAPKLVEYVQDRDLWAWKLFKSKEFSAGLALLPQDFKAWRSLLDDTVALDLITKGEVVLAYQKQLIEQHVKKARRQMVCGFEVPVVNATCLFSEIGKALCQGEPFAATYFDRADGKRQWSLCSREGGEHVGNLAKSMGGGGHPQAAGFETIIL